MKAPSEKTVTPAEYINAGNRTAKTSALISAILAGWATYLLSGGRVGASILVALSVLAGLASVTNRMIGSTAALGAHIDEVSKRVASTRPL